MTTHDHSTHTSHHAGQDPSHAAAAAPAGQNGEIAAAPTPSTVTGTTAGVASRFAGNATRLTPPESATMTGAQATCAAAGTASASANPRGTPAARSLSRHRGATSTSAPVARTESVKPALTARAGLTSN